MSTPEARDNDLFAALADAMRDVGGEPTAAERAAAASARELIGANDPWDLAELASDSLLDTPDQVRGAALTSARQLTFYADAITVQLEVTVDLLICRVQAADPLEVTLVSASGERRRLHPSGDEYELLEPPSGTVRIEVRAATASLVTAWFRL